MAFWKKRYVSKYTGKEIDDAVAKAADAIENPMTAAGDLIVGGTDGAAEKLAKGRAGQALVVNAGETGLEWGDAGMVNPMNAAGDIIVGGTAGAPEKLAKGTAGQALKVNAGGTGLEWGTAGEQYTAGTGIDITANAISVSGVSYITTAPTAANTDGDLKFVVLSSDPSTKYAGYIYIITG